MAQPEHNVCYEEFSKLCDKLTRNEYLSVSEAQYWVFESGYRAAMQSLLKIADEGIQERNFTSPRLQELAELILKGREYNQSQLHHDELHNGLNPDEPSKKAVH